MINVEIIKVHVGQILPCEQVTGNKEFTIGDLSIMEIKEYCDIWLVLSQYFFSIYRDI